MKKDKNKLPNLSDIMQIKNIRDKYLSIDDIKNKIIKNKNNIKYLQLPDILQ